MKNNLKELKQYFDQAALDYYIYFDDIGIDINSWIFYSGYNKTLNLNLEIFGYYNGLTDKDKNKLIKYVSRIYNIEIEKVGIFYH